MGGMRLKPKDKDLCLLEHHVELYELPLKKIKLILSSYRGSTLDWKTLKENKVTLYSSLGSSLTATLH